MRIIDAHTHIGRQSIYDFDYTAEEMIDLLKDSGVSGAMFHPITGTMAVSEEDMISSAQEALMLYEKHPDFLYPGITLRAEFPEKSIYLLDMFYERGIVWAGELLSNYGDITAFDDERWLKIFRICAERNIIVQLHVKEDVLRLAKKLPELTVVVSHLSPPLMPELAELPNVHIDISGARGGLHRDSLLKARKIFGYRRLLYGSDMPGYDHDPYILRVKRDFPEGEQPFVFGGNLLELLRSHGSVPAFGEKW